MLGFETIQYASKFGGDTIEATRLVDAARAAGFDWICLDRHTLGDQDRAPGGLDALARACESAGLPCRAVQSLRIVGDEADTADGVQRLARQVAALQPDTVPIIVLTEPDEVVLNAIRSAALALRREQPELRLALEFGPIFPVRSLAAARRLVARLDLPGVGLCVDTWHVFSGRTPWPEIEELGAAEIGMVQLNDHGAFRSESLDSAKNKRLLPGDGEFPLARFTGVLAGLGYGGPVSVEVVSQHLRSLPPERYCTLAFDAGSRFWPKDEESSDG